MGERVYQDQIPLGPEEFYDRLASGLKPDELRGLLSQPHVKVTRLRRVRTPATDTEGGAAKRLRELDLASLIPGSIDFGGCIELSIRIETGETERDGKPKVSGVSLNLGYVSSTGCYVNQSRGGLSKQPPEPEPPRYSSRPSTKHLTIVNWSRGWSSPY